MVAKANVEAGPRGEEGKLLGRQADTGDQPLLSKQDVKQKWDCSRFLKLRAGRITAHAGDTASDALL